MLFSFFHAILFSRTLFCHAIIFSNPSHGRAAAYLKATKKDRPCMHRLKNQYDKIPLI